MDKTIDGQIRSCKLDYVTKLVNVEDVEILDIEGQSPRRGVCYKISC